MSPMSVGERTREVGILKTLGFTRGTVLTCAPQKLRKNLEGPRADLALFGRTHQYDSLSVSRPVPAIVQEIFRWDSQTCMTPNRSPKGIPTRPPLKAEE